MVYLLVYPHIFNIRGSKATDHRGEELPEYLHAPTYLMYKEVQQIMEVRNYWHTCMPTLI